MSLLLETFCWVCLIWAVVMVTGLFILEAVDFRRNSRMRRAYWDWVWSGERSREERPK